MANSINKKFHTKMTLLSLILLLFPLVANSYIPDYNLAINCGSSINTTSLDNRLWVGDDDIHYSNLFTFTEPKTTNKSFNTKPNSLLNIEIPYTAAQNQIRNDKALEMVYRVNVGLNQVPPSDDTGMFRNWDNDFPLYLEKPYPDSVSSILGEEHLNYLKNTVPNYTAPEAVYFTARSYGMNVTEDYNVTWNFEVDSAFTYMVRLHFCEFDELIKKEGDRVFQIFIANTLAEENADVMKWSSGARLVPVYKDYVVTMYSPEGSSQIERVNLSIKLQRLPKSMVTTYRDVILNGIEILKISDYIRPNPKSIAPLIQSIPLSNPHQVSSTQSSKNFKTSTIFLVVIASGFVLAIVVGIIVSRLMRRLHDAVEVNLLKKKNKCSSSLPPHLCRYFTIAEIRAATNNFDDVFIIGVGGFGNVYKGCIDGSTLVAIKRLKSGSQQGANEFMNEIELLSQLRHVHLHGTLCEYLYGSNNQPLPWKQRLEILLGAARGLHYLHAEVLCARPPLVRDLDKNTASLVCWFQKCYNEGVAIEQIVDPFLRYSITDECLKSYCKLALSCLHDDGTQRPTMSQVVGDLEFALQLVVSEEGSQFSKAQKEGRYMKGPQFSQFISDEESDLHFIRSHTYKENTVSAWPSSQEHPFSEIRNPRPRSHSCQNLKVYI
ncbi:hypothetical protein P8452_58894 [Trifolium repens]|nr:hypothetical protein P8452_58894 [Trifolium repens]